MALQGLDQDASGRTRPGSAAGYALPARSWVRSGRGRPTLLCSTAVAGTLVLGVGGAQLALADSGTGCPAQYGSTCYIATPVTNGSTPSTPDFDKSGNSGNPGSNGGAVSQTFTNGQTWYSSGSAAAITVQSQGGNGSDGTYASDGSFLSVPNLSAGNGGTAGNASTVSITLQQESQAIGLGTGYAGIGVLGYSQAGNGGGGGMPTEGGLFGLSQPGGQPGAVTINANNDPNVTDAPVYEGGTGLTGGVIGSGIGILAESIGGNGGNGGGRPANSAVTYAKFGVDGAVTDANPGGSSNGIGGTVIVNVSTSVLSFGFPILPIGDATNPPAFGAGVWAISAGGNGGSASDGLDTDGGQSGNGGAAAAGGAVNVTILSGGSVTTIANQGAMQGNASSAPAIWAQSLGGIGGLPGNGHGFESGGGGGAGADGGPVTVTNGGALSTSMDNSPGILAQSFGGAGSSGGTGGGFGASGGEGASGGNGGTVTINGSGGSISTSGTNSPGILAQSAGGGGGGGGDSNGWLAVGGSGAQGGSGNTVTINISNQIATSGERSSGIMAQSIGGGGGNGGNASGFGTLLNITIGGIAGGGGAAGDVYASTGGSITTSGLHSSGLVLQSIGGGGGNGGAAYAESASGAAGASVAIGGSGGAGGAGNTIGQVGSLATNDGSIATSGADSFGILAQSIGGGGGVGGASAATAKSYSVSEDLPTISIAVALGGTGGAGGSGGGVTLLNSGVITTTGQGSAGIVAQSIGGGGGNGGDSSASATAKGGDSPITVSAAVAFGGNGGGAGAGSTVNSTNTGIILTTGESADGMLLQSIGGGGGNGGGGDAKATSSGDGTSLSTTLTMGGKGGSGGDANAVSASNSGAILTLGDGASGITAQAVAGGGGRGGGAAGTSNGTYSATVNIGGKGGKGGNAWLGATTNSVSVINAGTIVTFGADAPGIVAQSIGGSGGMGGMGGKGASTLGSSKSTSDGGNGTSSGITAANTAIENAFKAGGLSQYNSVAGLTSLANIALGNTTITSVRLGDDPASDVQGLENAGESQGDSGDDSNSTSISVNVTLGGKGATGGSAGVISITNSGSIGTISSMSDGILAQAIGGGGGKGGAAISSTTDNDVQGAIGIGGAGGGGGNGAPVTVTNDGSIITIGGIANGIVAQSIAGGGGMGGAAGAKVKPNDDSSDSVLSVPIAIGGNGGSGGNAGQVTVNNNGSIVTRSHDAIGIIAQSVAGGGGIMKTLSTDAEDNNGGGASASGGDYDINLTFGGANGSGTQAGSDPKNPNPKDTANTVIVNNAGSITTGYIASNGTRFGRNAFGILAQSIGGGGGLVQGGKPGDTIFGTGMMRGDAGSVTVNSTGSITTYGDGAVGIFAQSIGGGGGVAGDKAWTEQLFPVPSGTNHDGNGSSVTVSVGAPGNSAASVLTSGTNAPALLLQSLGGGGGRFTNKNGAFTGIAGGTGNGGAITADIYGSVSATGSASKGIYAESAGQGGPGTPGSLITINVHGGGTVSGGTYVTKTAGDAAAIYVLAGSNSSSAPNTLTNDGTITTQQGTDGVAVYNSVGWLKVLNNGSMTGDLYLDNNGGQSSCTGDDCPSGVGQVLNTGPLRSNTVRLGGGTLTNAGTFDVRGSGTATVVGNYHATPGGVLQVGADFAKGSADQLTVIGNAQLDPGSAVRVDVANYAKGTVPVLTVSGTLTTGGPAAQASNPAYLFGLQTAQSGNTLQVQTVSNLSAASAALTANQRSVAGNLEQIWTAGASPAATAALATVDGSRSYRISLNSLAGASAGGIVAAKQAASERFADNMISCEPYRGKAVPLVEESCVWVRSVGSRTTLASNGDEPGYRQDSAAVQIGGQREVAPGWFVGASAGYETSWLIGNDDGTKVSGQSALFGAMVKYQTGRWTFSGMAEGGYGWYSSKRQIQVGTTSGIATGSPGVGHAGLHARAAYQVAFADWYVRPSVTVSGLYRSASGYTESGSTPFDLAVKPSSDVVGTIEPDVEIGRGGAVAGLGVLRGFVGVGAAAYTGNDWKTRASFQSDPMGSFTAISRQPSAVGTLRAGVDLFTAGGVEAKLT